MQRQRSLRTFSTDAEKRLWAALRNRQLDGAKFRRQVWFGEYIVDFVCLNHGLIVEADGGQHAEKQDYDARRTNFLATKGFRVLRFWNNEVLTNLEGVVMTIALALQEPSPSHSAWPSGPLPLPSRERGE